MLLRALMAIAAALLLMSPANAQQNFSSHCIALSEGERPPGVQYAALGPDLAPSEVRLHYIGHSTYVLETPDGQTIATDFTGFIGTNIIPDVVTMNRAHSSHYTDFPDPAIKHVLRGWGENGAPAEHFVELNDLIIRNVTTDIRGGGAGRVKDGNSIFIFEVAGLCIGHLGHLHHEPSEEHYALIGRLDVVMVPVDGGMTLDVATMTRVVKRLRSSVVLPMHWFGDFTLSSFLSGMEDEFAVEYPGGNTVTLSLVDLPRTPTVKVLMPRPIRLPDGG